MPMHPIPPLSSPSLHTLRYEILPASHQNAFNQASDSYYLYLATSLTSASLPNLRALYAYYPPLPVLLLTPPAAPFGGDMGGPRASAFLAAGTPGRPNSVLPPSLQAGPAQRGSTGAGMPGLSSNHLQSPGLPPSMLANRMSTLSMSGLSGPSGIGGRTHNRTGSGFVGYNPSPFSPSRAQFAAQAQHVPAPADLSASLGLTAPLSIYTRPPEAPEMEWLVTVFEPPARGGRGRGAASGAVRGARPLSLVMQEEGGAGSRDWMREAKYDTAVPSPGLVGKDGGQLVGNGFGGYLELPNESGKHPKKKGVAWMG